MQKTDKKFRGFGARVKTWLTNQASTGMSGNTGDEHSIARDGADRRTAIAINLEEQQKRDQEQDEPDIEPELELNSNTVAYKPGVQSLDEAIADAHKKLRSESPRELPDVQEQAMSLQDDEFEH